MACWAGAERGHVSAGRICPTCGSENGLDARYCSACGAALLLGRLRPGESRRVVTVVLSDIVGSTRKRFVESWRGTSSEWNRS
jgi:ribosomal protein L40E